MKLRSRSGFVRPLALVALVALVAMLAVSNVAWALSDDDKGKGACNGKSTLPCKETDLSIKKTAKSAGQDNFIFTITVKNNGKIAAEGVLVTDQLSKRFELENVKGPGCSGEQTIKCKIGTLGAGKSATITIRVDVEPDNFKGSIKNTASVSSKTKDPEPSNNKSSVTVQAKGKKK